MSPRRSTGPISKRPCNLTKARQQQIVNLATRTACDLPEIAAKAGVSTGQVVETLERHGIYQAWVRESAEDQWA